MSYYLSGLRNSIQLLCLFNVLFFGPLSGLFAQDQCQPVGWVTQNGGVTGGGNATPTVVRTYNELKDAITSASVKVVHVSGTITIPSGGRISFQDQTGKSVIGLPGAKLVSADRTSGNSGIFNVKRCKNIIIRNLIFEGPGAYDVDGWDNMVLDNCTNIWVDHCEFQDALDGNFDIKSASDFISVTWCKFVYNKPPTAGGSGGSPDHRFSNLIGSGDGATGDRGKLRITFQYNWWAEGCKARMPRVRFGKVHIANNYFNSTVSSSCVMAGFEADLLVEGNVFEKVNTPIDFMNNTFTAVTARNNTFTGVSGNTSGRGTAFTPPYNLTVAGPATIVNPIKSCAGATLPNPTSCSTCSGSVSQAAELIKGGTGPSEQTINLGESIQGFHYTWANASSVTVTGMPAGVNVSTNTTAKTVTFSGIPTQAGVFTYTVTTVGGNPDATVTRTITVLAPQNLDCNGVANGSAALDDCGRCTGGNTGKRPCSSGIQAEDACLYDGTVDSNNPGFTGTGFVNTDNITGSRILWTIIPASAGNINLIFVYANGGEANRPATLLLNGQEIASLNFSPTGSWSEWKDQAYSVNLSSGINSIALVAATDGGVANLDQIIVENGIIQKGACTKDCADIIGGSAYRDDCGKCIGGTTGHVSDDADNDGIPDCKDLCPSDPLKSEPGLCGCDVAESSCIDCNGEVNGNGYLDDCGVCIGRGMMPCEDSMEAEEACDVDGILLESRNAGFSGAGYVNSVNALNAYASWSLQSNQGGTVTLSFRYANGGGDLSRDARILINGEIQETLLFPTTEVWTNWKIASATLEFAPGTNELRLEALTEGGLANLDQLYFSEGLSQASCLVTSFTKDMHAKGIAIYPNPTAGKVTLSEPADWILTDITGIELLRGSDTEISLQNYKAGTYLINIEGNVTKIVKE